MFVRQEVMEGTVSQAPLVCPGHSRGVVQVSYRSVPLEKMCSARAILAVLDIDNIEHLRHGLLTRLCLFTTFTTV